MSTRQPPHRIMIYLPSDVWEEVKRLAACETRTVNYQIVQLVREALRARKRGDAAG